MEDYQGEHDDDDVNGEDDDSDCNDDNLSINDDDNNVGDIPISGSDKSTIRAHCSKHPREQGDPIN